MSGIRAGRRVPEPTGTDGNLRRSHREFRVPTYIGGEPGTSSRNPHQPGTDRGVETASRTCARRACARPPSPPPNQAAAADHLPPARAAPEQPRYVAVRGCRWSLSPPASSPQTGSEQRKRATAHRDRAEVIGCRRGGGDTQRDQAGDPTGTTRPPRQVSTFCETDGAVDDRP